MCEVRHLERAGGMCVMELGRVGSSGSFVEGHRMEYDRSVALAGVSEEALEGSVEAFAEGLTSPASLQD